MTKPSEYWWDRSGSDPDLEESERRLGGLSFRETRGAGSMPEPFGEERAATTPPRRRVVVILAAAALFVGLLGMTLYLRRPQPTAWEVIALYGAPRIRGTPIDGSDRWHPGETLETGAEGRVKILVDDIGQVDVDPGSRLRLVRVGPGERRLALERGMIRAFIKAPPRQFFVETAGAAAVDLGCAYSVQVGDGGRGLLRVSFGWVAFASKDREVYVPAGAACALHPRTGPGTPYFEDAPERFREALNELDTATEGADGRRHALELLLENGRARDVLTLMQLLRRMSPPEAARVYERAAALLPPPAGVSAEAVLAGDPVAYDRWWRKLGLGEMKWWSVKRPE